MLIMSDFLLLIFLFIIAIIDIKKKKIYNKTSLLILLIGLFSYSKIYLTGIFVAIFIILLCIFLDEKYKGGGDIKLIGVIGILKGFNFTFEMYIISEILCYSYRKIKKINNTYQIPYAPFIFLSFLIKIYFL